MRTRCRPARPTQDGTASCTVTTSDGSATDCPRSGASAKPGRLNHVTERMAKNPLEIAAKYRQTRRGLRGALRRRRDSALDLHCSCRDEVNLSLNLCLQPSPLLYLSLFVRKYRQTSLKPCTDLCRQLRSSLCPELNLNQCSDLNLNLSLNLNLQSYPSLFQQLFAALYGTMFASSCEQLFGSTRLALYLNRQPGRRPVGRGVGGRIVVWPKSHHYI